MLDFTLHSLTSLLLALVPGLISLGLVVYIIVALPRNRLVDIFVALTLSIGLWQLSDAMLRVSSNARMAEIWEIILCPSWMFSGVLCFHFSLLYSKIIRARLSPWVIGLLYLPAFVFLSLYQSQIFVHHFEYRRFWGWVNHHNQSRLDVIMIYWISAMVLAACVVLFYHSWRVRKDRLLRSQSMMIAIGVAIPTISGILTQVIFPTIFRLPALPLTSSFLIFLSVATVVALKKFRLFTISELINNEVLLDELPVVVVSISDTGRATYINRYGEDFLAIDRLKLSTYKLSNMLTFATASDEFAFKNVCEKAGEGIHVKNIEACLVVKDTQIHVELSASPIINNNKVRGTLLCLRDITQLKESIQLLEQSEASLKEAQRISHMGSWEWLLHEEKVRWSDEIYRIHEINPGAIDITYDAMFQMVHPEDRQYVKEQLDGVLEALQHVEFNYRIITGRGIVKHLNCRVQLLANGSSKPHKLFGTIQDITRQVEVEITLQQKNMELLQSNANLEEFVFVASHDLKEPVRKIITFADMITHEKNNTLTGKSTAFFQRMMAAAKRMQTMIDDLLSLSIISQNNSFEYFSLQNILDEIVEDLDLKIKEKNARVETDGLPEIYVNPKQFRHLFLNLLSNSLKFARENVPPVITIKHKLLSLKEKESLSLIKSNNYLKITMQDNGIGFENAYSEKIFQMFQRLHGKVDYEGTGIGLAVVKKIVENHKGIILASGELNHGATFTIILPVVQKPHSSLAAVAHAS